MFSVVRAKAKVIEDATGIKNEIPVLLSEDGVLEPLVDYILYKQQDGRSQTWLSRVVRATQLLIEYMDANQGSFSTPKLLFQTFAKRLYSGTVDENGFDPSGLYWIPSSTSTNNQLISALTGLMDWLESNRGAEHMNPLVEADSYTQRLNYAAWYRKNQHNFLGHIEDKHVSQTIKKSRNIRGRRTAIRIFDDAIAFPERNFECFYLEGIGGAKDRRVALRDQLLLILMHGAGVRESDAMHLWVSDVLEDPENPDNAIVRLYHPEDGKAPDNWRGHNGKTNRASFLREKYALTPRNRLTGTQYVGWKTRVVDHRDNYIQLHWLPSGFGILFMCLWRDYLRILTTVERHHPYAFVSFWREYAGKPLTLNAFNDNYRTGLKRVGLRPSKAEGYSPHGHRHAYGRRMARAEVDPILRKKALHHASLESQTIYVAPGISDVTRACQDATERLEQLSEEGKVILPIDDWQKLTEFGFEDIDPDGLFTGKHPKLGTRRTDRCR